MHRASEFGLSVDKINFDLEAVVKRSRGVASKLNAGISHLLKKNKIDALWGMHQSQLKILYLLKQIRV
jgi:dihydrolipoamide dehydrogenase